MRLNRLALAILFTALGVNAADHPTFQCHAPDGTKFRFFLKTENGKIVIESPRARAREILLSPAAAFSLADERILSVWSGFNPQGATYLDRFPFSTEIRTSYPSANGSQFAELTVFIDETWRRDLECTSAGVSTPVKPPSDVALDEADRKIIADGIQRLDNSGGLTGDAYLRLESILRHWILLGFAENAQRLATFKSQSGPQLKYLHDSVVKQIKDRLPESRRASVDTLMVTLGQTGLSEVDRYLYWLKLGVGGNYPAMRSLARVFLKSPLARTPDVRAYFQREAKADLQRLGASDLKVIGAELDPAEKEFLEGLWAQATGAGTKASEFGAVEKLAAEMNAAIIGVGEKDKFGSDTPGIGRLQKRLTAFMTSNFYTDREARALFIRLVAPETRKLPPKTLQRLQEWLTPEERGFLEELRK